MSVMTGRFSVKLFAAVAALSLVGSGVAVADETVDAPDVPSIGVSAESRAHGETPIAASMDAGGVDDTGALGRLDEDFTKPFDGAKTCSVDSGSPKYSVKGASTLLVGQTSVTVITESHAAAERAESWEQVVSSEAVETFSWESSDADVATVNDFGDVTAKTPGTATISVTLWDDERDCIENSLSYTVTVVQALDDEGEASSVSADTDAQFLQERSMDSLEPYIAPELSQDLHITPKLIVGKDDRLKITETTRYPYSAIVSIADASGPWCTGFMVSEDVVLTAAHCVVDKNTGNIKNNLVFRPGANGKSEPFGRATAKKIIVGPEFKRTFADKYNMHDDWAVVKLSSLIGKKTGWFGLKAGVPTGTKVTIAGYPQDKYETDGLGLWYATGAITASGEWYASYIDSYHMQSGSPVYNASYYVVAIDIAESTASDGTRVNVHQAIRSDIMSVAYENSTFSVKSVKVTGTSKVLVGKSVQLKAALTPSYATNKALAWKSSNTEIATVDSQGKVTAKKPGKVTITASAQDGSGKSDSFTVTVVQLVTKVSISGASKVGVGKSVALKASVAPSNASNKGVTWKSSNTAVATVDSKGVVKGVNPGSVTITATAKDGSKKSASMRVSVVQLVTKVSVSGASKVAVGSFVRLNVFVGPSDASNKAVAWKSSNTAVATVDANGMVTTKKPGSVTITATAKDGSKKSGSVKISVLKQSFRDVPISHQFYSDVEWLAAKKIATGWSDKTFRPSEPVTRAAFAAFLYRMAGSPKYTAPAKSKFKDVPVSHQFYKEISWAASKGITKGWSDGTFRPSQPITRDAIASFLYRFAGQPKFTVTKTFKDVAGSEHRKAIEWLASTGISTGWSDGTFRPAQPTERGAIAAFLHRYSTKKIPIAVK